MTSEKPFAIEIVWHATYDQAAGATQKGFVFGEEGVVQNPLASTGAGSVYVIFSNAKGFNVKPSDISTTKPVCIIKL